MHRTKIKVLNYCQQNMTKLVKSTHSSCASDIISLQYCFKEAGDKSAVTVRCYRVSMDQNLNE